MWIWSAIMGFAAVACWFMASNSDDERTQGRRMLLGFAGLALTIGSILVTPQDGQGWSADCARYASRVDEC